MENELSIATISDGAAIQMIDEELQKVWANIQDINTAPDKARKVILEITITPNEERDDLRVIMDVRSKLIAQNGVASRVLLGLEDGAFVATEWVSKQTELERYIRENNNVVKLEKTND